MVPFDTADDDDPLESDDIVDERAHSLGEIGRGEGYARAGMLENISEFATVQLGVDRHGNQAGVPDGELDFEEFRTVRHRDGDPVAGPAAQPAKQLRRDPPGSRSPGAEGEMKRRAARDGWAVGVAAPAFFQPSGDVHRMIPPGFRG